MVTLPIGDIVGGIAGAKVGGKLGRQIDKIGAKKPMKEELKKIMVNNFRFHYGRIKEYSNRSYWFSWSENN